MHDTREPRRTGHTAPVGKVPLKRKADPAQQRLLLAAGVGISMLVILGLYAASFRYQRVLTDDTEVLPRWSVMKDDVSTALAPIEAQTAAIGHVKDAMGAAVNAKLTQAEGIAILKEKISSATTTQTK